MSGEGVKRAVSRGVWPPHRRGNSGTANIAAPKDSTTRAAKDGPVWFHCSALAVGYEGKCGADSAHANHSENEPSMKGLKPISFNSSRSAVRCPSNRSDSFKTGSSLSNVSLVSPPLRLERKGLANCPLSRMLINKFYVIKILIIYVGEQQLHLKRVDFCVLTLFLDPSDVRTDGHKEQQGKETPPKVSR